MNTAEWTKPRQRAPAGRCTASISARLRRPASARASRVRCKAPWRGARWHRPGTWACRATVRSALVDGLHRHRRCRRHAAPLPSRPACAGHRARPRRICCSKPRRLSRLPSTRSTFQPGRDSPTGGSRHPRSSATGLPGSRRCRRSRQSCRWAAVRGRRTSVHRSQTA